MRNTNAAILEYLHDATLQGIVFCADHEGRRCLRMHVTFDDECGNSALAGKVAEILFSDILIVSGVLWGHVSGADCVNSVTTGLLPSAEQAVCKITKLGIAEPSLKVTVALQSGSELAIACAAVDVVMAGEAVEDHRRAPPSSPKC